MGKENRQREEDESLAMELAQQYAQRPAARDPPMQVSHVLAGNEPDEFRRLFHSWQPWRLDELVDAIL